MSTIVTRAGKGSPLTNTEVDSNFTNLNTDKIEAGTTVTLTNKTLTSPKINEILDTSGNEILGLSPTASATDFLTVKNGIGTGVPLHVYADGPSTNIGLHIQPKGSGLVTISDGTDFNKGIRFRSSGSAASAVTLLDAVSTAGRVVTLPDATTTLVGRDTTDTLTNKTIAFSSNTFSGTLAIANGGTGQATANAAFNALAPSQTGNSGKYLTTDGTDTSWATNPLGTVTSVAASVPSFLSIAGSPITTSGTLAISLSGTALPTTSGGTGLTSFTSGGVVYASSSSALATGSALTFDGTNLGIAGRMSITTTSSPNAQGQWGYNATGGTYIFSKAGSTQDFILYRSDGNSGLELTAAGNIGIGVTPSAWSSASRPALQLPNGAALFSRSGSTFLGQNFFYNSSDTGTYIANGFATLYNQTSGQHQWFNAPSGIAGNAAGLTQAMTLTAAGLLSVGTTNAAGATIRGQGALNSNAYYYLDANVPFGGGTSGQYSSVLGFALYTDSGTRYNSQAEIRCISDGSYSGSLAFLTQNPGTYPNTVTERMRIGSGGRVGIGTTDPYGNLSVFMGTTAPQDSFYYDNVNMLQIGETSARGLAGLFAKRSTYAGASGYDGDLAFYNLFYAGAADYQWKERMRIQANGNVGIGTTAPSQKLEVFSSGTVYAQIHTGSGGAGIMFTRDASTEPSWFVGHGAASANANFEVYTAGNAAFVWSMNGSERGRFNSTGLGVGSNDPQAKIHAVKTEQQTDIDSVAQVLLLENNSTDTSGNLSGIRFRQTNGTNSANCFLGLSSTGNGATRARLVFAPPNPSGNATERMAILSSGNVGIGQNNPQSILDISSPATVLRLASTTGTNAVYQRITNDGGQLYFGIDNSAGNDLASGSTAHAGVLVAPGTTRNLHFGTNGTVRATITAAGDVLIGTTTNTNSSKLVVNGTISQTVSGTQYQVVDQSDIGTAPNEIPLNQYLGSLAYQNGDAYYNTGMTVGFRNRIINGDMHIAQRATSVSAYTGGGYQTLDRWNLFQNLGAMNIAQSSTAPSGFSNSMQFTVSTAASQTSSASSIVTPNQSIEGFNFDDMAWGTSNAKPVTVSVWVYSNLVGQYAIWMRNSAGDRYYTTPFTITTANTWQQISVTIAGDTSGTWVGATNGIGATVGICLAAGSSRVGTANTWSGSATYGVTGQVDWQATASNTFYFTGFQLEKGNIATSFDVRPYGTELALCQRYCFVLYNTDSEGATIGVSSVYSTTTLFSYVYLPVPMRTNPSLTTVAAGGGNWFNNYFGASGQSVNTSPTLSSSSNSLNTTNVRMFVGGFTGLTIGQAGWAQVIANAKAIFSAEL